MSDALPASAARTAALATFLTAVAFFPLLAALSPTPATARGYVLAPPGVAAALIAALALASFAAVLLARRPAPDESRSRGLLGLWLGATALSALLGLDVPSGFAVTAVMALGALFHLAVVRGYAAPGTARTLVAVYLLAGILACAAALLMLATGLPRGLYAANEGRAAGVFGTANEFAAYLLPLLFIALGVVLEARSPWLRALGLLTAVLGSISLLLTFSRGGWLGALGGMAVLAFVLRSRRLGLGLGVLGLALLVVLIRLPNAKHDPSDEFSRLATWSAGLRVMALFPLTGAGPMCFWYVYPAVRSASGPALGTYGALHPHNVVISLAADEGALGLGAALGGWILFAQGIRRGLRTSGANGRLCLAICAGLAATLVQGMLDTVGVVQMSFVWIPLTGLALAASQAELEA